MTDTQELQVIHTSSMAMPEMNVETAVERFKALGQFVKTIMREGVDFGIIPGTPKPTLLKPGAEKLCTFFGLTKELSIYDEQIDWNGLDHNGEPFFYFHYIIRLSRNGQMVAEADGSANSWESKHRYRQGEYKCPKCHKETIRRSKEDKGGGYYCWSKLGGCGTQFKKGDPAIESQEVGKKKNPDPADLVNTVQKMAYKRALVAATLVAVNASEYFTQDIEDLPDFAPIVESSQPTPQPQPSPTSQIVIAKDDLQTRKDKAIKYLAGKGKSISACEDHLQSSYGSWDEKDLEELKSWAKQGFPETAPDADMAVE